MRSRRGALNCIRRRGTRGHTLLVVLDELSLSELLCESPNLDSSLWISKKQKQKGRKGGVRKRDGAGYQ